VFSLVKEWFNHGYQVTTRYWTIDWKNTILILGLAMVAGSGFVALLAARSFVVVATFRGWLLSKFYGMCVICNTLLPTDRDSAFVSRHRNFRPIHTRSFASRFCCPGGAGREYSEKNLVGVCGPLPKTLTLFMTKFCDFQYPIYDLTLNQYPVSDLPYN